MNTDPNTHPHITRAPELDSFESTLLTELKSVVAERASSPAALTNHAVSYAAGPARRPRPVRWVAASVVGLAAAGLAVATTGSSAAYAISQDANGDVTVTISRLEGANALEQELAGYGITADVTYHPAGKMCAPGRFTPAAGGDSGKSTATSDGSGVSRLTFPKGSIKPGQTLVLESMWPDANSWVMSQAVAQGTVGACVEEDANLPEPPAGPVGPGSGGVDGPAGSGAQTLTS